MLKEHMLLYYVRYALLPWLLASSSFVSRCVQDNDEPSTLSAAPLGTIRLEKAIVRRVASPKFGFEVNNGGARVYLIAGETEEDMQAWIDALCRISQLMILFRQAFRSLLQISNTISFSPSCFSAHHFTLFFLSTDPG